MIVPCPAPPPFLRAHFIHLLVCCTSARLVPLCGKAHTLALCRPHVFFFVLHFLSSPNALLFFGQNFKLAPPACAYHLY